MTPSSPAGNGPATTDLPTTFPRRQHVDSMLKYFCEQPSEVGIRVANLLDAWAGLHHIEPEAMRKVDWANPRFIVLKLNKYHSPGGGLATFDFDDLTRLVFLAHDLCVRIMLMPCNQQLMDLVFFPRNSRDAGMSARHPTLEEAVRDWRDRNPLTEGAPH